jgi:hypothetical protein
LEDKEGFEANIKMYVRKMSCQDEHAFWDVVLYKLMGISEVLTASPDPWSISMRLHRTSQKTATFILATMRTLNVTSYQDMKWIELDQNHI